MAAFQYLRGVIDSLIEQVDVDAVSLRIGELLDESVVVDNAERFAAKEPGGEYQIIKKGKVWDLSKIDFDKLKEDFRQAVYKNIEIADLRRFIQNKLEQMLQSNVTRIEFAQRLPRIIDTYNFGKAYANLGWAEPCELEPAIPPAFRVYRGASCGGDDDGGGDAADRRDHGRCPYGAAVRSSRMPTRRRIQGYRNCSDNNCRRRNNCRRSDRRGRHRGSSSGRDTRNPKRSRLGRAEKEPAQRDLPGLKKQP